jgi:hypothetical protein
VDAPASGRVERARRRSLGASINSASKRRLAEMRLFTVAVALISSISARLAQQHMRLTPEAVKGRSILLANGNTAHYHRDGTYTFQSANGATGSPGRWKIAADGGVCVDFSNGRSRCDHYVEKDGALYIRNVQGNLFKVRFAR